MTMILRAWRAAPLSLAFCLFALEAHAGNGCASIFEAQYGPTGTLADGGCQTCHQGSGGPFNVYGEDLIDNGAAGAGFNCSVGDFAAALVAVQDFDSDGEGNTNLVEITAGTQPGWCDTNGSATCVNSPGTPPSAGVGGTILVVTEGRLGGNPPLLELPVSPVPSPGPRRWGM